MNHPLKYDADNVTNIQIPAWNHPVAINLPQIKEAGERFENNLLRGNYLLRFPEYLARHCSSTFAAIYRKHAVLDPRDKFDSLDGINTPGIGFKTMEIVLSESGTPEAHAAIEYLLTSVLLNAWLSLEVLATDMWVVAVNMRPMSLGDNAFLAARHEKAKDRLISTSETNAKPGVEGIRIDVLREHDFDLGGKMGSILHRSRKFDFNSLAGIEYAYKTCFGENVSKLFDETEIRALEIIRHLLVHRGGLVDEQFKKRMEKNAKWAYLNMGDSFPVDTAVAVDYSNAASRTGTLLLQAVNQWLEDNPK